MELVIPGTIVFREGGVSFQPAGGAAPVDLKPILDTAAGAVLAQIAMQHVAGECGLLNEAPQEEAAPVPTPDVATAQPEVSGADMLAELDAANMEYMRRVNELTAAQGNGVIPQ